jgi:hypothetical protein
MNVIMLNVVAPVFAADFDQISAIASRDHCKNFTLKSD